MSYQLLAQNWRTGDPREVINKHATIVIWSGSTGTILHKRRTEEGNPLCFSGTVETKHSYSVWTGNPNKKFIAPDERWPEHWLWCFAPSDRNTRQDTP